MTIKNLAQLKKALAAGKDFQIVQHYIRPEYTGQIRRVSKAGATQIYTKCIDEGEERINNANGGKGYVFYFGKAGQWDFSGDLCTSHLANGRPVWTIKVLDDKDYMEPMIEQETDGQLCFAI